jgi:hypothetical protein
MSRMPRRSCLLDGAADGRFLHCVEGAADLADGVTADRQWRRLGLDVDVLSMSQPFDHAGQSFPGQLPGRFLEFLQLPEQRTRRRNRNDDRRDNGDKPQPSGQEEPDDNADTHRLRPLH